MKETKILLLEIADPGELAGVDPDFVALQRAHDSINGVLVTAPARLRFSFALLLAVAWHK